MSHRQFILSHGEGESHVVLLPLPGWFYLHQRGPVQEELLLHPGRLDEVLRGEILHRLHGAAGQLDEASYRGNLL